MIDWLGKNWIEITGVILALGYLILEIKQHWMMWTIGIISSSIYVFINYEASLYALTGLNACYVLQSSYGLYRWKLSESAGKNPIRTSHITSRKMIVLSGISLSLFILISWILTHYFKDSAAPYADALVFSLSIVATWMTAHKIIEHWFVWIFVNYFTVGLYVYTKLYPTAVLFFIYGTMAIVGWLNWKKLMKK